MTEYVLPFTHKQVIRGLKVLMWVAIIGFSVLYIYSWLTSTDYSLRIFISTLGMIVGWLCVVGYWVNKLAASNQLPTFRCKYASDDIPSKEEAKK